jgi:hypothetical protein
MRCRTGAAGSRNDRLAAIDRLDDRGNVEDCGWNDYRHEISALQKVTTMPSPAIYGDELMFL